MEITSKMLFWIEDERIIVKGLGCYVGYIEDRMASMNGLRGVG